MKEYAIIVAGGRGHRMQSELPKQYMLLGGKPILMHTIEAFRQYSTIVSIVLVLPKTDITLWRSLCDEHQFHVNHTIVAGGSSRFQSVKNGLKSIQDDEGLVAIHDGVRPLINPDIIAASFRLAAIHGSAIASARLKESLRKVDKDYTSALDRAQYRLIQTPQTFQLLKIKQAYQQVEEHESLTDDASIAEKNGMKISLFEGAYDNIKITTPEDLIIAEALLKYKK